MKKLSKVVMSLGLLMALLVGGGVSLVAASGCCDPVNCCQGDCHCPCCQ
jgi:hypothetical protein